MASHKKKKGDPQPVRLGTQIYIMALGDKVFTCPVCGVQKKRAMISEYKKVYYCSEDCVKVVAANE